MRASKRGLERETSTLKTAKNESHACLDIKMSPEFSLALWDLLGVEVYMYKHRYKVSVSYKWLLTYSRNRYAFVQLPLHEKLSVYSSYSVLINLYTSIYT